MNVAARRRLGMLAVILAVAVAAYFVWQRQRVEPLPPGIFVGNGRLEATEIDIATKTAGRIKDVLVREGDFVEAGQVVAEMDTESLAAELRQTEAKIRQAQSAATTAQALADQRRDSKASAAALIVQRQQARTTAVQLAAQRESELAFAENELKRSEELFAKGFISAQRLDTDRTRVRTARAATAAAKSQVAEAEAAIAAAQAQAQEVGSAIAAAESQVAESKYSIEAATAAAEKIKADIADATLRTPRAGRVLFRTAEPSEVLPAGGKVLTVLDISDVYMTFFLPETVAGKVALGSEARLVLDAAKQYVIPAKISFVAAAAQFTPKTVETASEREKLVFRVKAQIDPELLKKHRAQVKTGLPGVAYVKVDPAAAWPPSLEVKLPQ
jgi:HlyD family secretion protein